MSRKDSKGMFAAVLGQLDNSKTPEGSSSRSSSPHLMKVAEGVRQMQERSELSDKLLKSGEQIVELDPDTIAPSAIHDRFDSDYDTSAITEIVDSMRTRGQIVPGLVRPLKNSDGHFQIVYGRRRLAAAKELGIKFKAAIRELTDEQAVIFQGEENSAREDLSFIEKCAFAFAQQEAGFTRDTICSSLSTGKSHVSEMIKIAAAIPQSVIIAIGKAPGIGRGRWEDFYKMFSLPNGAERAEAIIQDATFLALSSDEKFSKLLSELPTERQKNDSSEPARSDVTEATLWVATDNTIKVNVKNNGKTATLTISARNGATFAKFLTGKLNELYEEFNEHQETTGD